ncbi:MAG: CpaD family pilus assembly lipoprotein [Hyphomicrobiales bacterium]|nr:CpaD family pilus assembly lipoprotein [Hyphomicrobiales bacterium]
MKAKAHHIVLLAGFIFSPLNDAHAGDMSQPTIGRYAYPSPDCAASDRFIGTLLWDDDNNNDFNPEIGCSSRSNLEAMVDRPHDLRRGRGTRYSDGERAADAVIKYRNPPPPKPAKVEGDARNGEDAEQNSEAAK